MSAAVADSIAPTPMKQRRGSRMRARSAPCRRVSCGAIPVDGQVWGTTVQRAGQKSECVGDACFRCAGTQSSFEVLGDWASIADQCNTDKAMNVKFEDAAKVWDRVQAGETMMDWFPTEAATVQRRSWDAMVWYRGLRPAEFDRVFGYSHEERGLPLEDLHDPRTVGVMYKGVLVPEDARIPVGVGVSYRLTEGGDVRQATRYMDYMQVYRKEQIAETWDSLIKPSRNELSGYKKLRLCRWNYDDLMNKVANGAEEQGDGGGEAVAAPGCSQNSDGSALVVTCSRSMVGSTKPKTRKSGKQSPHKSPYAVSENCLGTPNAGLAIDTELTEAVPDKANHVSQKMAYLLRVKSLWRIN